MSSFQWEHQLFCYDWLFYKCFSVPFGRNVLTRSGYWLLITQLNCLYCTTDFLALTWPGSFDTRGVFVSSGNRRGNNVKWLFFFFFGFSWFSFCFFLSSSAKKEQLQLLTHSAAITEPMSLVISVNITSYESLIV